MITSKNSSKTKNRMKVDIRLVFGKNELQPEEINWLRTLPSIRTSFCRNLHAKCYLNQDLCIVTSLNLHDFNQVNNSEMGILIVRDDDPELFQQANDEAQRLIRISDEVRMSFEKVKRVTEDNAPNGEEEHEGAGKLSTSRLAKKLGLKTQELTDHLRASRRDRDQRWPKTDYAARPQTWRRVAGQRRVSAHIFSGPRPCRWRKPNGPRTMLPSLSGILVLNQFGAPEWTSRKRVPLTLAFGRFRHRFLGSLETNL